MEFDDVPAFQADQMIMMPLIVGTLVMLMFFPMDYLIEQTRLNQKGQGAINRRLGNAASIFPKAIC